ncbi:hypothetical protein [Helcococcus kunzii]|uniref:hypothetical protein n=1 Tax=Helcococcus kunzii TaxID=40091 RepID=UPI0024ADC5F9|nr:hypothetical protein [Helcococcus kunzii]
MELVLPNNYVEIEQDEMMYLDGGWSVTVNRRSINQALAKGILAKGTLGSWAVASLGFALSGVLVAVAGTLAIVYATNTSFTIGF